MKYLLLSSLILLSGCQSLIDMTNTGGSGAIYKSEYQSYESPEERIDRLCSESEKGQDYIIAKYGSVGNCISVLSQREYIRLQRESNSYQRAQIWQNAFNNYNNQMNRAYQPPPKTTTNCTTNYWGGTAYTNCN